MNKTYCPFYQGGLGLPNRDYYFDTDERAKPWTEYKTRQQMFQLLGDREQSQIQRRYIVCELAISPSVTKLEDLDLG
jgi:putative endopeptidase